MEFENHTLMSLPGVGKDHSYKACVNGPLLVKKEYRNRVLVSGGRVEHIKYPEYQSFTVPMLSLWCCSIFHLKYLITLKNNKPIAIEES